MPFLHLPILHRRIGVVCIAFFDRLPRKFQHMEPGILRRPAFGKKFKTPLEITNRPVGVALRQALLP